MRATASASCLHVGTTWAAGVAHKGRRLQPRHLAHLHSPLLSKLWMVMTTRVRGMSCANRAGASQNCGRRG